MKRTYGASKSDITFLRSLTADAEEIRGLRLATTRRIRLLRARVVDRVVSALYRRYKNWVEASTDEPLTFLEWVDECRLMSETYKHHSFEARFYWATRPVSLAARSEFSLNLERENGEQDDSSWYYSELAISINSKDPSDTHWLYVYPSARENGFMQPTFRLSRRVGAY